MEILLELNFKQRKATRLFTSLLAFSIFIFIRNSPVACLILLLCWSLALKNPKHVYAFARTIKRDVIVMRRFIRLNIYLAYVEHKKWSVARMFDRVAMRQPKKACFKFEDSTMTFGEAKEFTDKAGAFFKEQGLMKGDCIALLMETRIEYVCLWLGLSKIGVITALINSNQRRETLLHSIKTAKPRAVIVSSELISALEEIRQDGQLNSLTIYQFDNNNDCIEGAIDLKMKLEKQSFVNLENDIKACQPHDKMLYVYTSGTTGLPKAAVITNLRYFFMATAVNHIICLRPNDIIYNPLPLYHSAGGMVAVGNSLLHGCCTVLRKKFSASNFWTDCIKYECTVAQYIGELCRYLLYTPPKPEEKQHRLRLMYGNGLRAQIWTQFVNRFNIPHISEFYGSTEGNSNLGNVSDQIGAVGFRPIYGQRFFPVQLIKCNEDTGEIVRDRNGFCIRCKPGETGLLIGLVNPKRAVTAYNGYADREASEKKLLKNVFRNGDLYFNSGDMMVTDILGFFYFKDRTGDTFRWRGENVSTSEVEAIIANVIGLKDCVVYGVEIPHVEGKAGMAAIVDPERVVDLKNLSVGIRGNLPEYAQPLFIRFLNEIPSTETFKLKKRELSQEGFDIRKIKDAIYFLHKDGVYRLLDQTQFDQLMNGKAGL